MGSRAGGRLIPCIAPEFVQSQCRHALGATLMTSKAQPSGALVGEIWKQMLRSASGNKCPEVHLETTAQKRIWKQMLRSASGNKCPEVHLETSAPTKGGVSASGWPHCMGKDPG